MLFNDYDIIRYRPEFGGQISELQQLLWDPDVALNEKYLQWKHENNPYVDEPLIYLSLYNGNVVGMTAYIGTKWQVGSPPIAIMIPSAGDSVIYPDHRDQGLFAQMNRIAMKDLAHMGYRFSYSLSANRISFYSFRMMGWRNVGFLQTAGWRVGQSGVSENVRSLARRIPLLPLVYRRFRNYSSKNVKRSSTNSLLFSALDKRISNRQPNRFPHVSVEKKPRPAAMADLIERLGSDGRMRQVRDQQFFSWRFQNPLSIYRFLYWESTRLEGYLILQTRVNPGGSPTMIIDWEATNLQVRADLLQAALQWGKFNNLVILSASLSGDVKNLLYRHGFAFMENTDGTSPDDFPPNLLLGAIHQEKLKDDWVLAGCDMLDLASWDLRSIYSDGF
jgi:hypothetical protein